MHIKNLFKKENLVYVNKQQLTNLPLSNKAKKFILKTGFPYLIHLLRFTLDFEPISKDIKLNYIDKNGKNLFSIGYKPCSHLTGTLISLSRLGLNRNASLSQIAIKLSEIALKPGSLGYNEYYWLDLETQNAWRICLDLGNNEKIIYINPQENMSVGFVNSSIQKFFLLIVKFRIYLELNETQTILERMEDLKKEIKIIDPPALEKDNALWNLLIEWTLDNVEEY